MLFLFVLFYLNYSPLDTIFFGSLRKMTEDTKVTVTVTTKKLTVFMALDKQDHKIARQLLKASEFGREEKWTAFVEYCERIGVDGCEMCQWTHELLDTEYNMGYKDRIEILRIR